MGKRPLKYAVARVNECFPQIGVQAATERLSYGSFVSLKHKILYIENPKVACSSVKHFLRELAGASPVQFEIGALRETRLDMFVHARSNVPLPSLVALDEEIQERVLTDPSFLRFSIVRNPYGRLISAWRNKVLTCEPGHEFVHHKAPTFRQFVEFLENEDLGVANPHWRRQTDLLLQGAIPYTHVGRAESINETEATLSAHLGRTVNFRRDNPGLPIGDASLTDDLAARINALYSADFSVYGYSPESWRQLSGRPLNAEQVLDEIVERNRMIARLYDECAALKWCADHPWKAAIKRLIER